MKPGNLRLQGAKSCGKPRYEGNGRSHILESVFYLFRLEWKWRKNHERIPVYIRIRYGGASRQICDQISDAVLDDMLRQDPRRARRLRDGG